jgi:hypothetical protein
MLAIAPGAWAEEPASATHEAARHFDRAVALHREADYQGALVEFKRAYALAPNPTVLYNVGETQYQLQDYAGALATLARYLDEAPPGAAHRPEVEASLEVLRARVGHLTVVTVPPGADVSVDDVPAGRTPLAQGLLASVGRRKVTASVAGRPPVTRYVEVAADDSVTVTVELPAGGAASAPGAPSRDRAADGPAGSGTTATLRTVGWITTGMLAAGAIGTGALALKESADLKSARNTFPVPAESLQAYSDRARTYSILADSLGVAAVVAGGVMLLSTLGSMGEGPRPGRTGRLRPGLASLDLEVTF